MSLESDAWAERTYTFTGRATLGRLLAGTAHQYVTCREGESNPHGLAPKGF